MVKIISKNLKFIIFLIVLVITLLSCSFNDDYIKKSIIDNKYNDLIVQIDNNLKGFNFYDKQYLLLLKAIIFERLKKYKDAVLIYKLQKKYTYYSQKRISIISKYYLAPVEQKSSNNNTLKNEKNTTVNKNSNFKNNINNKVNISNNSSNVKNRIDTKTDSSRVYKILDNLILSFITNNSINTILKYDFIEFMSEPLKYFISKANDFENVDILLLLKESIYNNIFDKNGIINTKTFSSSQLSKYLFYLGITSYLLKERDFIKYFVLSYVYGNFYYYSIFSVIIINNIIKEVINNNLYHEKQNILTSIFSSLSLQDFIFIRRIMFFYFRHNNSDFSYRFNYNRFYDIARSEAKTNYLYKNQIKELVELLQKFKKYSLNLEFLRTLFYLKELSFQKNIYDKAVMNYYIENKEYSKSIVYSNFVIDYLLKLDNLKDDKQLIYFDFKKNNSIKKTFKLLDGYFNKFYKLVNPIRKKIIEKNDFYRLYNYLYFSYPLLYIREINKMNLNNLKNDSIDSFLLLSLIRVESHFNRYAISIDGARGLTQILPQTASWIFYKHIKYSKEFEKKLFEPEIAIEGATKYLYFLKRKFNSLFLALASYNAGYNRVERNINKEYYSLKKDKNVDKNNVKKEKINIFYLVETFPISETNLFLKKIIRNYMLYKYIYDKIFFLSTFSEINLKWR